MARHIPILTRIWLTCYQQISSFEYNAGIFTDHKAYFDHDLLELFINIPPDIVDEIITLVLVMRRKLVRNMLLLS